MTENQSEIAETGFLSHWRKLSKKLRAVLEPNPALFSIDQLNSSEQQRENSSSRTEDVFKVLFTFLMLSGGPFTARLAFAASQVADVVHLIDDPIGRGMVYDKATSAIRATWPKDAAEIIIIALDRAEDGRSVSPEVLLPKLIAEAYFVPGDYGQLMSEWRREDEIASVASALRSSLQQLVTEQLNRLQNFSYVSAPEHPSVRLAAERILTDNRFFGVNNPDLLETMQERIEETMHYYSDPGSTGQFLEQGGEGPQLTAGVDYFSTLPAEFVDRYAVFFDSIQRHKFSEGLTVALVGNDQFLSLQKNGFGEQYERLIQLFQELDALQKLDADGWKIFFSEIEFSTWVHLYTPEDLRTKFFELEPAVTELLQHGRLFAKLHPELVFNSYDAASVLRTLSNDDIRVGNLLHAKRELEWRMLGDHEEWGALVSLGSDFNEESLLRHIHAHSSIPAQELFIRFFIDQQSLWQLESDRAQLEFSDENLVISDTAFKPFIEDVDPVFQSFVQGMLMSHNNRLWDEASGSVFALEASDAQILLNWFLNSPDSNSFSDEDALLFAAVAFQHYRLLGASDETQIHEIQEYISRWGTIIGPHYADLLRLAESSDMAIDVRDKVLVLKEFFRNVDDRNIFTEYDKLLQFYPGLQRFEGASFDGVIAQLDETSLVLQAERFHQHTELMAGEIAFVMPWTYFQSNNPNDPAGLIEFAVTTDAISNSIKELSFVSEKTDFSDAENLEKYLFCITDQGVFIEQAAVLLGENTEKSTQQLIQELQMRGVSGAFVPNFFFNSNLSEGQLVGFGSRKLSQFFTTFLVLSATPDGKKNFFLLDVKSVNRGESMKDFGSDYYIDENDLLESIKRVVPGEVTHVLFGDPGHSLVVTNGDGIRGTRVGLSEVDTFRLTALPKQ